MPRASGQKFHYRDHDTDEVDVSPPVQNQWYEVFHAQDVRLIWCSIYQKHDELAALSVETRWTIDGTVYFNARGLPDDTVEYLFRNDVPSTGGTAGLAASGVRNTAAYNVGKRGLDFKVEVRMTGVPGTNQQLRARCVRETLVLT